MPITNGFQQPRCGLFNKIQHMLKTVHAAVIGIRDIRCTVFRGKFHKEPNPGTSVRITAIHQLPIIAGIHSQHIIEFRKIPLINPLRPLGAQINAAS